MKALVRHFARHLVIFHAGGLALAFAGAFVAERLGVPFITLTLGGVFLVTLFLSPILLGQRLPYLLSLPVPRVRLILLAGLLNYFGAALSLVCASIYYGVLIFVGLHQASHGNWEHIAVKLRGAFVSSLADAPDSGACLGAGFLAGLFLLIWFALAFFFLVFGRQAVAQGHATLLHPLLGRHRARQLAWLGGSLALSPVGVFVLTNSVFLLVSFISALFALGLSWSVATNWIYSPPRVRTLRFALLGVAALQSLLMYLGGVNALREGRAAERLEAAAFLGIISPRSGPDLVRSLASLPMSENDARSFSDLMNPSTPFAEHQRRYAWGIGEAPLPLNALVANQEEESALRQLLALYDPAALSQEDLLAFETRWRSLKKKGSWLPGEAQWLGVSLEPALVIAWLGSPEAHRQRLALLFAEFHPRREYLAPIVEGLRDRFPANLIPEGIEDLSLLEGKTFDLRTYRDGLATRPAYWDADCAHRDFGDLLALERPADERLLRRCLREKAVEGRLKPRLLEQSKEAFAYPLSAAKKIRLERAYLEL